MMITKKLLAASAALGLMAAPAMAANTASALSLGTRAATSIEGNDQAAETAGVVLAIGVGVAAVVAGVVATDNDDEEPDSP